MKRRRLDCPRAAKGRAMRGLAERFGGDPEAIPTDGVKPNLDEDCPSRVLMLPDPDNPVFYVYAESGGAGAEASEETERLLDEHSSLVGGLITEA